MDQGLQFENRRTFLLVLEYSTTSFDAYLRHRARQLLGDIAGLTTKKNQRADKVLKLNEYTRNHSVAQNTAQLRTKAGKQLKELHEAAQAHRPEEYAYLQARHTEEDHKVFTRVLESASTTSPSDILLSDIIRVRIEGKVFNLHSAVLTCPDLFIEGKGEHEQWHCVPSLC